MLLSAALVVASLVGCSSPFKPPVRIGVTSFDLSPLPPFLPKRILFQRDLEDRLNEPVVFDLMTPRQIRVHLGTGRAKFAMLSPADFCEAAQAESSEILSVPINMHGKNYRRGLIIVSPRSMLTQVSELKGLRFHFMPNGDVLNEAALGALLDAGIAAQSIDRGILGLELDTKHISSLEVAKSVVLEENVAGVIDEADYESWPERGGSLLLLSASKEQVRVIGKTVRIPEGPFLVSKETPAELREDMQDYLFKNLPKHGVVLATLGVKGFGPPIDPSEYEPYFAVHRKLQAAGLTTPPATQPATDAAP